MALSVQHSGKATLFQALDHLHSLKEILDATDAVKPRKWMRARAVVANFRTQTGLTLPRDLARQMLNFGLDCVNTMTMQHKGANQQHDQTLRYIWHSTFRSINKLYIADQSKTLCPEDARILVLFLKLHLRNHLRLYVKNKTHIFQHIIARLSSQEGFVRSMPVRQKYVLRNFVTEVVRRADDWPGDTIDRLATLFWTKALPSPSKSFLTGLAGHIDRPAALTTDVVPSLSPYSAFLRRIDQQAQGDDRTSCLSVDLYIACLENGQLPTATDMAGLVHQLLSIKGTKRRQAKLVSVVQATLASYRKTRHQPKTLRASRQTAVKCLLAMSLRLRHYALSKALFDMYQENSGQKLLSTELLDTDFGLDEDVLDFLLRMSLAPKQTQQDNIFPLRLWAAFRPDYTDWQLTPRILTSFFRHLGSLARPALITSFLHDYKMPLTHEQGNVIVIAMLRTQRIIPTLRVMTFLERRDGLRWSLHQVYNPLMDLISRAHTRRVRLLQMVIKNMPNGPTELSYLFSMRGFTRRWDMTEKDLARARQIKLQMIEDGITPDSRHQAEIIVGLTRRNEIIEATSMFLDLQDPSLVETYIAGMLVCRLADRGLYGEAKRCIWKWRSSFGEKVRPVPYVNIDRRTMIVADLYLAAKLGKQSTLDAAVIKQYHITRSPAIIRLEKRLASDSDRSALPLDMHWIWQQLDLLSSERKPLHSTL